MKSIPYISLSVFVTIATLASQVVQASESKTYLRVEAGPSWVSDIDIKEVNNEYLDHESASFKMETGLRVDVAFGVNLSRVFALEVETGALYNSFDSITGTRNGHSFESTAPSDIDLWQVPLMLNGVFTLLPDSRFHPYIGGGIGGIASFTPSEPDSDSYSAAFQVMVGVKYELSDAVDIGLGYKFLESFRQDLLGDFTVDYISNHSVLAAVSFKF